MSRNVTRMDIVLFAIVISMSSLVKCSNELTNSTIKCEDARLRCAYRTGCGTALQHYLFRCSSVLHGQIHICPESCQHALIALTSTDEGKELMKCYCGENDHVCTQSKQKIEICRSSVTEAMNKTRISCRIATWICNADAACSTALFYYNKFCKSMFHGKKCTFRCKNSIKILRHQEKADKLNTCVCDGEEDHECEDIHRNMNLLCDKKVHQRSSSAVGIGKETVIDRIALFVSVVLLFLNI